MATASTSLCSHPAPHIEYDPILAVSACTLCGYVLPSSSSAALQVLGRVLEDQEGERGRVRLFEGGVGYQGSVGRGLDAGEGKGLVYHERRKADSEQFMRKVLNYFSLGGLFQRTKTLFAEAKRIGKFKWGPNAKMIAVACVYIAVRERDKPVTLEQLAGVNDLDYVLLTRAQFTVKYWLKIKTHEVDPIIFLERPIVHLSELFSSSPNPPLHGNSKKTTWSKNNLAYVRAVNLAQVRNLAAGLLAFGTDINLTTGRVGGGVAAAAVVVALEGVSRKPAPLAAEFFDELGHLLGVKSYTVAERYREFQAMLADYAPRLPWLGATKADKKGKGIVKRDLVQYTADIVQFRKSLEARKGKEERERKEAVEEAESKVKGKGKAGGGTKKEESEDEEFGTEEDEDDEEGGGGAADWDDEEGEEDPPGGPANFFIDPLVKPKAAAAALRAGDDATTTFIDAKSSSTSFPPPPPSATWSQLAASFSERKAGGATAKRPAEYMRQRPGPVKRVRTIEQVAQSLLSPFGGSSTPPSTSASDYPSPVTAGVSPAPLSPPDPSSATTTLGSPPPTAINSLTPASAIPHPAKATPFASHSSEAFHYRQLLLSGHDPSAIFEGTASYEPSSSLRAGRLDRLLFTKRAEDISDSELFDEGELEGMLRGEEEVLALSRTEKWLAMPEPKMGAPRVREARKKRTRMLPCDGVTREEKELMEQARRKAEMREIEGAGGGSGGGGGGRELFKSQRSSKVSQETKERLAKIFAAEGGGEEDGEAGDGAELELEALNFGLGVEAAQSDSEDGDEESSDDEQ